MRLYPFYEQEGDIGAGSAPEAAETTSEPSSVVTEGQEPSGDGNAPTPAAEDVKPTGEIDQQQSFAQRLKEQTDKRLAEERTKWDQEVQGKLSYLEKQAKISGFATVEEYTRALDAYEQQKWIDQEADRMGIDPETYAQYFAPVNDELSQLRNEVKTFRQQQSEQQLQQQRQKDWGALYESYPALSESSQAFNEGKAPEWFTPEMQELVGMGYKPVHAYELANKETIFRQKEQEVLARVTGRDGKQVLPSTDQPNNVQFDPANMSDAEIQAISERVRRGERITLS
ncbi:hypothetical protein [Paenibacillus spongiae]|uniref:Uncharacterized protein n=1 Tax=Paenibacillus spongiae TaxID=2909671 RepID=A0ABY5SBA6_9BACL|nr:hypothetical protein [Paenibacillus spongiae]UVI31211.1 hypothetical protein L1F29_05035 [Paenibacillus spongiae]